VRTSLRAPAFTLMEVMLVIIVLVLLARMAMPLLTAIFGYFPGKRLGWMEDTPRGVVRDWNAREPRFENAYRRGAQALDAAQRQALVDRFAAMRGATLAVSLADDGFGTICAVQRLLRYFRNSRTIHLHIAPESIGASQIGHFAFFHSRFEASLWRIALEWLRNGRLSPEAHRYLVPAGYPAAHRG
jgi:predicted alpha/beta hydrolase